MTFQVFLTDDASRDLEELYDYIESHDAPGKADYVLDQIEKAFSSLSENPERGAYPKELRAIVKSGVQASRTYPVNDPLLVRHP